MCCCSSAETFGQGWERVANAMWQFGKRRGGEERKCEKPGEFPQRSGQKSSPISATNSIFFDILWSFFSVSNIVFLLFCFIIQYIYLFSCLSKDRHRHHLWWDGWDVSQSLFANVDFVHTTLWNSLGLGCL